MKESPYQTSLIMVLILFVSSRLDGVRCKIECDEDDEYTDPCNSKCTVYDYEDFSKKEESCSHNEFIDPTVVTPIKDLEKYNEKNISVCCFGSLV